MNDDAHAAFTTYMNDHQVLHLGTTDGQTAWQSVVYFAYNDGLIYFTSAKSSLHGTHIGSGANVAFSVADSSQSPATPSAVGVQGAGYCRPAGVRDLPSFARCYGSRFASYQATFGNLSKLREMITGDNVPYLIEIGRVLYRNKPLLGGRIEIVLS